MIRATYTDSRSTPHPTYTANASAGSASSARSASSASSAGATYTDHASQHQHLVTAPSPVQVVVWEGNDTEKKYLLFHIMNIFLLYYEELRITSWLGLCLLQM